MFFITTPFQIEDNSTENTTDIGDDNGNDEEEATEEEDEEERSLPGDADEVSTVTRAKQLAEQLKATARKILRDLGRILAISLLALAGKLC